MKLKTLCLLYPLASWNFVALCNSHTHSIRAHFPRRINGGEKLRVHSKINFIFHVPLVKSYNLYYITTMYTTAIGYCHHCIMILTDYTSYNNLFFIFLFQVSVLRVWYEVLLKCLRTFARKIAAVHIGKRKWHKYILSPFNKIIYIIFTMCDGDY